jgi:signal transduction histidine kinase
MIPTAPLADWGNLDSHGHSVQFYEDDGYLLDGLAHFVGSALGGGDAAIVIATAPHREGLLDRLDDCGLDTTHAIAEGRFVVLDAAEMLATFMGDSGPDAVRFDRVVGNVIVQATAAARSEHSRVAAFGEMVALLWADGRPEAAIRLEQLWNTLAQTHSFYLHCAYPMAFFSRGADGGPIEQVCAEHSHVVPAESYAALTNADHRLRSIALLQQKAHALEAEIEARRAAEAELLQRNEELQEALIARDEFLSVAAHELKTPVTSLRLVAQTLLRHAGQGRELPMERVHTTLQTIDQQTAKLNHLMARLLDRAQIQAGKLRVEPVPTDVAALVRGVIAQRGNASGHPLVVEGPEHLGARIDPLRFEQVITNLLDNAIKFSPAGGTVTISVLVQDDGGVRLAVTDHGVGIPLDQRERIFERFHQAHDTQHLSGLGLGLFITHEIVAMHGGCVWVEEPEHPGARFVVALPPATDGMMSGHAA